MWGRKEKGYILVVQKTIPLVGESLEIRTNLPVGANTETIYAEINKITAAMDKRMAFAQGRAIENEKEVLKERAKQAELEKKIRESLKKDKPKYN